MTSITSFYSGSSQLLSSQSGQASAQDKTAASTGQNVTTTTTAITEEAVSSSSGAYAINLSDEAKAYLAALEQRQGLSQASTSGFSLNTQQVQKINDILAKYASAEITQDNFNKIQDDLRAAGLAPEQLAVKERQSSFNGTSLLLDALNGKDITQQGGSTLLSDYQDNTSKYMAQVEKMWRALAEG